MSMSFVDKHQRPLTDVPLFVIASLFICLVTQVAIHTMQTEDTARWHQLPPAPDIDATRLLGLGDEPLLMRGISLWLQSFDAQQGKQWRYENLDYSTLIDWLKLCLTLNPESDYPLLLATRVYSSTSNLDQLRLLIAFVRDASLQQPAKRWRWLADSATLAKHRLQDLDLALSLAKDIRLNTQPTEAPGWARQMEVFLLEDMGEIESASILLGALIESGAVTDDYEKRFLLEKLEALKSVQRH